MDTFAADFQKAQEQREKLASQMEECRTYKAKNPMGSTARFEYTMRSAF